MNHVDYTGIINLLGAYLDQYYKDYVITGRATQDELLEMLRKDKLLNYFNVEYLVRKMYQKGE